MYNYIAKFMAEFNFLYKSMKANEHSYDENNLSSYHLEGDIWTHTMMVTRLAEMSSDDLKFQISALLHDIGKPASASFKHDKKKKHFIGHEGISAYLALDYINSLDEYDTADKKYMFKLIALHGILYKYKDSYQLETKLIEMFKYDSEFFMQLLKLNWCDQNGRIGIHQKTNLVEHIESYRNVLDNILKMNYRGIDETKKNLVLLVGPPGSGKTTYAQNLVNTPESPITRISRDNLLMTENTFGYAETYNERWKYFQELDGFKSIDAKLSKAIGAASKDKKDNIVIDMTNMSTKSRRKIIGQFNRSVYNVHIKLFATSYGTLLLRNAERALNEEKSISNEVLLDMLKRFDYPTQNEFETMEVICSV